MAQKVVQFIIGQILTDEELRARFVQRPLGTLSELRNAGLDLTSTEIDALAQTDHRLWQLAKQWIDPRLQRCRCATMGKAIEILEICIMNWRASLEVFGRAPAVEIAGVFNVTD